MKALLSFQTALPFISAILSFSMIFYFIVKSKRTLLFYGYLLCQGMIFVWSLGQVLEELSTDRFGKWWFVVFQNVSVCFIGYVWLMFCLIYSEKLKKIRKEFPVILALPSVVLFLIMLTNDQHHLYYKVFEFDYRIHGPAYWFNMFFAYFYSITGMTVLFNYSVKKFGNEKKQSLLLIFASVIPLLSNFLFIFNLIEIKFDITPVSFSLSLMLFAVATFRYRFMDIIPVAVRKLVDNMKDSIIVLDEYNRVVDWNNSFISNFMDEKPEKSVDVNIVLGKLKERLPELGNYQVLEALETSGSRYFTGEINLIKPVIRSFQVNIQPVMGRRGEVLGRVITFNDITEYKRLLDELGDKNTELSLMNEQLEKYASTVEELTLVKERNRFARDVHDTLGHTMTLLISLLEVVNITYRNDPDTAGEKLTEAIKASKNGLRELRRSINGLVSEKLQSNNLKLALNNLATDFGVTGVDIDLTMEGLDDFFDPGCSEAVYRLCQEALTNSVRHGCASQVTMILKQKAGVLRIFIIDNGKGCSEVKKGFGLKGMEERVKGLEGKIVYGSDGESGFNIKAEIPVGRTGQEVGNG